MSSQIDVVFIADATHSLQETLVSLPRTLFESLILSSLSGTIDRFAALLYGDYTAVDRYPVTRWSGWVSSHTECIPFLEAGELGPGGDEPEAAKTALKTVLDAIEVDHQAWKKTVVVWYTDAPPHSLSNHTDKHPNFDRERAALGSRDFDWVGLCTRAQQLNCTVFPLMTSEEVDTLSYFQWLAYTTGGAGYSVDNAIPSAAWTALTLNVILRWLGCAEDMLPGLQSGVAKSLAWKKNPSVIIDASKVSENEVPGYLPSLRSSPLGTQKKKTLLNLKAKAGPPNIVHPSQLQILPTMRFPVMNTTSVTSLSMKKLRTAFHEDTTYARRVISVLTDLVADRAALTALTASKLFSCLWRESISSTFIEERKRLLATFQSTLAQLDPAERGKLRLWLEQGYDASEDVREAVDAIPIAKRFPAVMCMTTMGQAISRPQDLTQIATTCRPSSLRTLIRFFRQLRIIHVPMEGTESLPLALPTTDFIPMLPSILFPGLIISLRSSAIFAMLLIISQQSTPDELLTKSKQFLTRTKGTWLDMSLGRNHSLGFLRLTKHVLETFGDAFTDREMKDLRTTRLIQGLLMNRRTDLVLQVHCGERGVALPDEWIICSTCTRPHSFTLTKPDGTCVFCAVGESGSGDATLNGSRDGWFRQCSICNGMYGVHDSTRKPCRGHPICHYCRTGDKSKQTLVCQQCHVTYITPGEIGSPALEKSFTCPCCKTGTKIPTESVTTTIETLFMAGNAAAVLAAVGLRATEPLDPLTDFFSLRSAFKLRGRVQALDGSGDPPRYTYKGRGVVNTDNVTQSIRRRVETHRAESGMCMMCCTDLPKDKLHPSCGRKGCTTTCCSTCLDRWYGALIPGHRIPPANTRCAFCRRVPTAQVMCRHNRDACQLRQLAEFDPEWHYGWCVTCMRPREWIERVCAADPPTDTHFRCGQCMTLDSAHTLFTRSCPSCTVTIEKTDGCDHITCASCSAHFCWRCAAPFSEHVIYEHIYTCSGDDAYREHGPGDEIPYDMEYGEYYDDGY
ncbi:hypothetical protein DFS34DRAFT_2857 [Phlyctochytrium arcticum]|nr:hypothetical protein DFS34DRAFT_2857 [Phlyctochytrium arcticum]